MESPITLSITFPNETYTFTKELLPNKLALKEFQQEFQQAVYVFIHLLCANDVNLANGEQSDLMKRALKRSNRTLEHVTEETLATLASDEDFMHAYITEWCIFRDRTYLNISYNACKREEFEQEHKEWLENFQLRSSTFTLLALAPFGYIEHLFRVRIGLKEGGRFEVSFYEEPMTWLGHPFFSKYHWRDITDIQIIFFPLFNELGNTRYTRPGQPNNNRVANYLQEAGPRLKLPGKDLSAKFPLEGVVRYTSENEFVLNGKFQGAQSIMLTPTRDLSSLLQTVATVYKKPVSQTMSAVFVNLPNTVTSNKQALFYIPSPLFMAMVNGSPQYECPKLEETCMSSRIWSLYGWIGTNSWFDDKCYKIKTTSASAADAPVDLQQSQMISFARVKKMMETKNLCMTVTLSTDDIDATKKRQKQFRGNYFESVLENFPIDCARTSDLSFTLLAVVDGKITSPTDKATGSSGSRTQSHVVVDDTSEFVNCGKDGKDEHVLGFMGEVFFLIGHNEIEAQDTITQEYNELFELRQKACGGEQGVKRFRKL